MSETHPLFRFPGNLYLSRGRSTRPSPRPPPTPWRSASGEADPCRLPLPAILVEPIVREALLKDLGRSGDLTTDAIVPRDLKTKTVVAALQEGVVAGLDVVALAFRLIDPAICFEPSWDGAGFSLARALRSSRERREA